MQWSRRRALEPAGAMMSRLPVTLIVNPHAGERDAQAQLRAWAETHPVEVVATGACGDATRLARELAERPGIVMAAGGDGTVHEVVNGLAAAPQPRAILGLVPLGTANDLCRTLGIPADPLAALDLIERGAPTPLDLVRVRAADLDVRCVNICTGGFGAAVTRALDEQSERKVRWGDLAYARQALSMVPQASPYTLTITHDGQRVTLDAVNIAVANGRYAGGGMAVAPQARVDDGLLDLVICRMSSFFEQIEALARLVLEDLTSASGVVFHRARRVTIESDPPMPFTIDGEPLAETPITFEVEPSALRVLTPPAGAPVADAAR